jgi:poly-gamma-glutamate synthesis protein (capsule biosynthesis protein)
VQYYKIIQHQTNKTKRVILAYETEKIFFATTSRSALAILCILLSAEEKNQEQQQEISRVTHHYKIVDEKINPISETIELSQMEKPPLRSDSIVTVTISAVGDLMCHVTQYTYAKTADGKYDFNHSFSEIKKYISASDLAMGNLETTFAGASLGYSGYPNFNSPDEYAETIKNAGFDLLLMANNHSMDMGENGLLRTIRVVEQNQLHHTGTFTSQHDRDSIRIFFLKGIKLAVLNYTYGTNGILPAKGHEFMLNIIDTALIKKDILMARKQGAEIVLVYFHYGTEYVTEPTESQRFIVGKTIEYGADIILG